ncbi:hypothetical protein PAMA_004167 [Pampus argenteus]
MFSSSSRNPLFSPWSSMEQSDCEVLDISTKVQLHGVLWKRPFGRPSAKWSRRLIDFLLLSLSSLVQRFFIIKDSFLLYYAENEKRNFETNRYFNIHPKGVIPLGGCVVSANEELGMPFAVEINLEDFSGTIALAAESEDEQIQWIEMLQDSGKVDLDGTAQSLKGVESEKEELSSLTTMLQKSIEELSQEKRRTLELLGEKENEESCRKSQDGEELGDVDLLQDLRHIEEQMKVLLNEKEQADNKLKENEQRAKVLQHEREYYSSQARTLQQSLSQLTTDKQQTEAELKAEIESRVELEKRLKLAEEALQGLEKGLNSVEWTKDRDEKMKGDVTHLRRFFEECICAAEIEAKLPAIMKNAVYLHKAAARRIKSCRIQRRASRRHWLKHSKSFAVANTDDDSMEELRATARRLTSDSSFRESVYKIITRKDATNNTED